MFTSCHSAVQCALASYTLFVFCQLQHVCHSQVSNRSLRLGSNRRTELRKLLGAQSGKVLQVLATCLSHWPDNQDFQAKVLYGGPEREAGFTNKMCTCVMSHLSLLTLYYMYFMMTEYNPILITSLLHHTLWFYSCRFTAASGLGCSWVHFLLTSWHTVISWLPHSRLWYGLVSLLIEVEYIHPCSVHCNNEKDIKKM